MNGLKSSTCTKIKDGTSYENISSIRSFDKAYQTLPHKDLDYTLFRHHEK